MNFLPRITVSTLQELRTLKPGQYFTLDGTKGRYMGSTPRTDYVLWRNQGNAKFSRRFRQLATKQA